MSTVPPPATAAQVGVIATTLPPASLPTAENWVVPPVVIVAGLGVTVMVARAPAVTMTVAEPLRAPTVARTEFANVPGVPPATNSPPVPIVPPPLATDQTGEIVTTLPLASRPTAVNCCDVPTLSVDGVGVTVMDASVPAVSMTDAVPLMALLLAWLVLVNVPPAVPAG